MNNKIVYINSIVQFRMFILVSKALGLVTGRLSGSLWRTFEFWSRLTKSLLYNVHCVHTKKFKKSKKAKHGYLPFFIRKVAMIAKLLVDGLK